LHHRGNGALNGIRRLGAENPRLRQQGLRPIQTWVPDMRSPAFVREAHLQSLAVASSPHAKHDQDFIDAITFAIS